MGISSCLPPQPEYAQHLQDITKGSSHLRFQFNTQSGKPCDHHHTEEIPDSLVCCQDPPGLALVDFAVISSFYAGLGRDPEWQFWAVPAELS